jgi:hypothetical protein
MIWSAETACSAIRKAEAGVAGLRAREQSLARVGSEIEIVTAGSAAGHS